MSMKITGLSERIAALQQFEQSFKSDIRKELIESGAKMTTYARQNHNFTTRSGNLERSINATVDKEDIKMSFGFIDDNTLTPWKKGPPLPYGVWQHEGTYSGYRQSRAANKYAPTPGKGGIKADHFIVDAWDQYIDEMVENVKNTAVSKIKGAVENGLL